MKLSKNEVATLSQLLNKVAIMDLEQKCPDKEEECIKSEVAYTYTYSTVHFKFRCLVHTGEVFHLISIQLHLSKAKHSMEFFKSVHTHTIMDILHRIH